MSMIAPEIVDTFMGLVDDSAGPDACHLWLGSRTAGGYGRIRSGGVEVYAHRVALSFDLGRDLDPDELALHSCDNPPCVNPRHLRAGTQKDNMQDAVKRNRIDLHGLELGRVAGKTLGKYRTGVELCGTVRGYSRHLRHGDTPCSECRSAVAAYNRARKAARA